MKTTNPSRQVLEEMPGRTVKFLRAVGTNRVIAQVLATRGYTTAVHREGWRLLHAVSGFDDDMPPPVDADPAVRNAAAEIDAWDEPNFRIARAALAMKFPAQEAALFAGKLAPAVGDGSLLTVKTFLDRLDVLEHGTKTDKAALARLAERGITKDERKRLRALLAQAASAANIGPAPDEPTEPADATARPTELVALYAWFSEWSEVARTLIKRRDQLIALGLASRKKKQAAPAPTPAPAPTSAPAPTTPPAPTGAAS